MEETLAYKCVANRVSSTGRIVGTVIVQGLSFKAIFSLFFFQGIKLRNGLALCVNLSQLVLSNSDKFH